MGELKHFNLNEYISKYNLEYFIETGTWIGNGIKYASTYNFKNLYSVDMLKEYYDLCLKKFNTDNRIILYNGTSIDVLPQIFQNNTIKNTLFWLDAHLPNFYDKKYNNNYNDENKNILIPLEEELKIIIKNKDISMDVFIIDDLRIYEKGNFTNGEWLDVINSGYSGIDFIFNLLSDTHDIVRLYDDEGYIICTPKTI